jgi:hypothetical protein
LIGYPSRVGDGPSHRLEVAIQEEYDIIGQPVLGEPRETTKIGEENGDLALLTVARSHGRVRYARAHGRLEEWRHLEIAARPELTGKAHIGWRSHPLKNPQLLRARRREHAGVSGHAHTTGRAAASSATH